MAEAAHKETHGFQTEVKQLLHLMIHSLYSNKEIFLRELVSNAADAADKLRFRALENDSLYENEGDLSVKLSVDSEANTITIVDNGIGMSRDEVIANLGTIAKSGTKDFFSKLSGDSAKDSQLIGQFLQFALAPRVQMHQRVLSGYLMVVANLLLPTLTSQLAVPKLRFTFAKKKKSLQTHGVFVQS